MRTILIVSSAHWSGDPRLNRHVRYLESAGMSAALVSHASGSRFRGAIKALAEIRSQRPDTVILPDPELFVVGAIWSRLNGVKALIDIHEDYGKAAAGRAWIPRPLKPLVGLLARLNDLTGRMAAHGVIVAARELARDGDRVVLNIPNPEEFEPSGAELDRPRVVYVGDVTIPRGALEIAELAQRLPSLRFLVIGPVSSDLAEEMMRRAGPEARLDLIGQLAHDEAWLAARGSIAGLSLLRPYPAYLEAVATKLWEYCAAGLPPVVTDLPGQRRFVEVIEADLVGRSIDELAATLRRLSTDPAWRDATARTARGVAESGWADGRPDVTLVAAVQP